MPRSAAAVAMSACTCGRPAAARKLIALAELADTASELPSIPRRVFVASTCHQPPPSQPRGVLIAAEPCGSPTSSPPFVPARLSSARP